MEVEAAKEAEEKGVVRRRDAVPNNDGAVNALAEVMMVAVGSTVTNIEGMSITETNKSRDCNINTTDAAAGAAAAAAELNASVAVACLRRIILAVVRVFDLGYCLYTLYSRS